MLAEQFGGRFELRSRSGEGTVAELWLPVAQSESEQAVRPERQENLAFYPLCILAVDDDGLVLTNTAAMLEDLGHTCYAAFSGREALEILNAGDAMSDIDLVITDQVMAGMTGVQLIEAIHARWPGMPVMLATGFAETDPSFAASVPRLSKPFTQAELGERIAQMGIRPRTGGQVIRLRAPGAD